MVGVRDKVLGAIGMIFVVDSWGIFVEEGGNPVVGRLPHFCQHLQNYNIEWRGNNV